MADVTDSSPNLLVEEVCCVRLRCVSRGEIELEYGMLVMVLVQEIPTLAIIITVTVRRVG